MITKFVEGSAKGELIEVREILTTIKEAIGAVNAKTASIDLKVGNIDSIKEALALLKETSTLKANLQGQAKLINDLATAIQKLNAAKANSDKQAASQATAEQKLATETEKTRKEAANANLAEQKLADAREKRRLSAERAAEAEQRRRDALAANNMTEQQFQQETRALYDSVRAHQEMAKSLREEAAAKAASAAKSSDAADKTRLEAEASQLLRMALEEEKAIKTELVSANKKVAASVRDNIAAEALLTREIDKLRIASEKEAESALRRGNAYEQLKMEYNEQAYATKVLAAEYVMLQRAGSATTDELEKMRKELQLQQQAALQLSNALLQMEQAVGQNQRSVGNYANATAEITQILRELPNFAISTQTGILSLSNNLPMLQAALSRLAQTIDANTGRAIGWRGVLKLVAESIFSVQGGIVILTTLLVAYGDQILEAVKGTNAFQKATELYNAALEDTLGNIAKETGQLEILRAALNNTSVARQRKIDILQETKKMFPGYLDGLTTESSKLAQTNKLIDQQIQLMVRQAEMKAAVDAVAESAKELNKAQIELNAETSFFEEIWSDTKWLFGAGQALNELSQSSQELLNAQHKLHESGVINRNQYVAMYYRINELDKAQKVHNETIKNAITPVNNTIRVLQKHIAKLEEQKAAIKETSHMETQSYKDSSGQYRKRLVSVRELTDADKLHKEQIEAKIVAFREEIKKINDLAAAYDFLAISTKRYLNDEDLAVIQAETNARKYKRGTKERLEADLNVIEVRAKAAKRELKQQYGYNELALAQNKEYQAKLAEIESRALEERRNATEVYEQKITKGGKKLPFDPTDEILAANQRIFEANQSIELQILESTNAQLENIFNLESNSLRKRLAAYEQYVLNLQAVEDNENQTRIKERTEKLAAIESIEKRISFVVTEENLRQVAVVKGLTDEERRLLLEKFALQAEEQSARLSHHQKLEQIEEEGRKRERYIIDSSIRYSQAAQTAAFDALRDESHKAVADQIKDLDERRRLGQDSEKSYWRQRTSILASESRLLEEKERDFLEERKNQILEFLSSDDIPEAERKQFETLRANVEKLLGDLTIRRPPPREPERRSILSYLGLHAGPTKAELDNAYKTYQDAIRNYDKVQLDVSEKINESRRIAAQSFGEGTAEYAAAVVQAEQDGAKALEAAAKVREVSLENYTFATTQSVEKAKEKIAQELENLAKSILQAYNTISENTFNSKKDALDEQSKLLKQQVEEELAANQASLDSQEEKEKKERAIKARAAANEKRLAGERARLEHEQAARRKRMAIFEATVTSGIAIGRAFADYKWPVSGIIAALVAAQTLANIAAITSEPLPAYWQGTPDSKHPGGKALVSEKGPELGILPSGQMFMTPDKPTIMDLPRGTEIIPNHELASAAEKLMFDETRLMDTSSDASVLLALGLTVKKAMNDNAVKITKAINEKQELNFHWRNGELKKSIRQGNAWIDYIGSI